MALAPAFGPPPFGQLALQEITGRQHNPWVVPALAVASAMGALGQETKMVNSMDFSAFKIIYERNIFDPSRRPPVPRTPPPKIVDSFSLVGTMSRGKGTFAVFDGLNSEYHKVCEAGDRIGSYSVERIASDAVKLWSGTNVVDLRLGEQMRRNDDGSWSLAEANEAAGTAFGRDNTRNRTAFTAHGPGASNPENALVRMQQRRLQEMGSTTNADQPARPPN